MSKPVTPEELDKGLPHILLRSRSIVNYLAATSSNDYLRARFQLNDDGDNTYQCVSTIYTPDTQYITGENNKSEAYLDISDISLTMSKYHTNRYVFASMMNLGGRITYYLNGEPNIEDVNFAKEVLNVYGDNEQLVDVNVREFDNLIWFQADDGNNYAVYSETFRNPKMKYMEISYWNLRRAKIITTRPPPVGAFQYKDNWYIWDKPEAEYEGDDAFNYRDMIYLPIEQEEKLDVPKLNSRWIKINGIQFKSSDLRLFYNTYLYDTLVNTGESEIELPNLPLKDLRLLRDVFTGIVSLLYFYENCSKYAYELLSGKRTMLDIFDLKVARRLICSQFRFGIPLREQIAGLKYNFTKRIKIPVTGTATIPSARILSNIVQELGEIGRLDELIQIAKEP